MKTYTRFDRKGNLFQTRIENCISCKRTLIWDEMFHNGYTDGPVLCHLCKQARNEVLNEELRNMEPSDEN